MTWREKDETPYTVLEYLHFLVVMTKFSKYFVSYKRGIHVIRGKRLCLTKYVIKSLKWIEPSNLLLKSRSNIKKNSMFRKWRQIAVTSRYPVLFGLISHSLLMSLLVLLLLVHFTSKRRSFHSTFPIFHNRCYDLNPQDSNPVNPCAFICTTFNLHLKMIRHIYYISSHREDQGGSMS